MKPIFYLFMKRVFFEIFYGIVKLNMDFIPTKPILFVCIKLCICIYCCYIKVLYAPVLQIIFFVISDTQWIWFYNWHFVILYLQI